MMSKSVFLFDEGNHNGPHLMFFTALKDGKHWGAGASGSPVLLQLGDGTKADVSRAL